MHLQVVSGTASIRTRTEAQGSDHATKSTASFLLAYTLYFNVQPQKKRGCNLHSVPSVPDDLIDTERTGKHSSDSVTLQLLL